MAFDIIVPGRRRPCRADADKVRVTMGKAGKPATLELRIVIGSALVERLGYAKGQRVNIMIGREASPDRGQLAIAPAEDGHFRLMGSGRTLEVRTRSLHPTLALAERPSTATPPIQATKERLIVKLPEAFLSPRPVGSLMGDPPPERRRA